MKFEEILPLIREGKKAKCPTYDDAGEFWIAGYIGLPDVYDDKGELIQSEKHLTIHRMDIMGKFINDKHSWGICRWAIMDESWELME
jgi:hypothetical protein